MEHKMIKSGRCCLSTALAAAFLRSSSWLLLCVFGLLRSRLSGPILGLVINWPLGRRRRFIQVSLSGSDGAAPPRELPKSLLERTDC